MWTRYEVHFGFVVAMAFIGVPIVTLTAVYWRITKWLKWISRQ
jgi:hypothetical protein